MVGPLGKLTQHFNPKGELARDSIPLLLREGYTIKVFDLVDPDRSDCYNPFHYIRNDADVLKLIANFIRNTTPKNAHSSDPFWDPACPAPSRPAW